MYVCVKTTELSTNYQAISAN